MMKSPPIKNVPTFEKEKLLACKEQHQAYATNKFSDFELDQIAKNTS